MKPIKPILLSIILTLGVFFVVMYSSCSKDECGAITCLNKGKCQQGICMCPMKNGEPSGATGANCETVYRVLYSGKYKGKYPYNTDTLTDSNHILTFFPTDDTDDLNSMEVIWQDTSLSQVARLPVKLYNHSSAGSSFIVQETIIDTIVYTGNGTINANMATMRLIEHYPGGATQALNFNNYLRQ
jgi:hypothetical protein